MRILESRVLRVLLVLAAGLATAIDAAEPDGVRAFQRRVNEAIDRGVVALLRQQELDGSWRSSASSYGGGMTALAVYTLVKCGVEKDHPALRRALRCLDTLPDPDRTYSMATTIIALCAMDPVGQKGRITRLTETLISWQQQGGFAYPTHDRDLSNTQYAALALRAASQAGVKIPRKVWDRMAEWTLLQQEEARGAYAPAGFRYFEGKNATGSMTAAGVSVLALVAEAVGRAKQPVAVGRDRGLKWLETHFSATRNPHPLFPGGDRDDEDAHHYYYLYGIERVGALLDVEKFGDHDWYREGAEFLIERQDDDGGWKRNQPNTCFALLFLSKATAPATGSGGRLTQAYGRIDPDADVSVLASGDSPLTLWIGGFGDVARETLEAPGEEGRGPRVVRVEYVVRVGDAGDDRDDAPEPIAVVAGDPRRPCGDERFAAQHQFTRNGMRSVIARVTCVRPGGDPADDADLTVLESEPLDVPILAATDPVLLSYLEDAARNRIDPKDVELEFSSERPGHEVRYAIDGLQAASWRSEENDGAPWVRLTFDRPLRAQELLLSPFVDREDLSKRAAPPRRVTVMINKRDSLEVDLDRDLSRKTVVTLPAKVRLRTLEIRAVGPMDEEARRSFGFAEVELVVPR